MRGIKQKVRGTQASRTRILSAAPPERCPQFAHAAKVGRLLRGSGSKAPMGALGIRHTAPVFAPMPSLPCLPVTRFFATLLCSRHGPHPRLALSGRSLGAPVIWMLSVVAPRWSCHKCAADCRNVALDAALLLGPWGTRHSAGASVGSPRFTGALRRSKSALSRLLRP